MTDVLDRYINPSYTYKFAQGPDVVQTPEDALQNGINCISLAHLVLEDIFDYRLPSELHCAEMYLDKTYFERVENISEMERGDLVWFGTNLSSIQPEEFTPIYDKGALINWAEFPVKHVSIYTGKVDNDGSPLLLHSSHIDGTNSLWPLRKFAEHKRYRKLYGITRLALDR